MFCEKCGAKNDSSSKFCEKCGAKLDNETEVKQTKKTSAKKTTTKKTTVKKEEIASEKPKATLSKKQKTIGGLVLVVIVALVIGYVMLKKAYSLDSFASKVFDQLSSKETISDKYLKESLDSDKYFVTLGDNMKNTIKENDIVLKNKEYEVKTGRKKVTIKYRDSEEKDKYRVMISVDTDGKALGLFDKYIVTKITIKNESDDKTYTLYDPKDSKDAIVTAPKNSKVTIDGKELTKSYLDSKNSKDDKDVYKLKGLSAGKHKATFTVGGFKFKKELYAYSTGDNEFNLVSYISEYNLDDKDNEENVKSFKEYITTYYEYVMSDKTYDDFSKKYTTNEDIKDLFEDSKEYVQNYSLKSFKVTDVKLSSIYYYSSDEELVINYKISYDYENEYGKGDSYRTARVTYKLTDVETPADISYLPF